tara:strand:- start:36867 stop:37727 length:861 start_codon:yes stop_codon:yes gene_type:complete
MQEANQFFEFVNLREHIRIAKENGAPQFMWTQDPILQEFRFCNVFREDDRTTRYFRDTVREPLRNEGAMVFAATVGWRWFNRIETCGSAKWWTLVGWDREMAERDFRPIQASGLPVVTGAYVIKTPNGVDKLTGILDSMEPIAEYAHGMRFMLNAPMHSTLEAAHEWLMQFPYLGRFMAYEVVTDLRHTCLLENATDIMTWANAGPGAIRGLGWVLEGNPDLMSYGPKKSQEAACELMRCLLAQSLDKWDFPDRPWEMREVEHCLCEYDKYRRAQGGQRLKRRYQS